MKLWRYHKVYIVFGALLVFITLLGKMFYQSNHSLNCIYYRIQTDKKFKSIRILQLTDLHNSIFEEKNQELVDLMVKQSPDLILITGDLLNSNELNTDIATDLISDLSKIAPVYVSLGNHEVEYQQNYGTDIVQLYADAGAVVLDRQYQDLEVNGQKIRLGGIYGYCLPEKYLETNEAD
ncbi:MAG: metallophosphoesterase, partial [Blautia sp.]